MARVGLVAALGALLLAAVAHFVLVPAVKPLPPFRPTPTQQAIADLEAKLGPRRYSQGPEELVIRDYFGDAPDGFFVDVGAGDALQDSNTAYLETRLGWSGIAIDAEPQHADSFLKHRPRTRFLAFFVADKDAGLAEFWVSDKDWRVSSTVRSNAEMLGDKSHKLEVKTITLDTLLARERVAHIDFLSMDIEQGEPAALTGFDIGRYRPRFVCIETQPATKDFIARYMASHGYVRVLKYSVADVWNAYYEPGPDAATLTPASRPPAPRPAAAGR